jgi:hypothetical protein
MIPALEEIAHELNIPPENLWQESLRAYVTRELRLIELGIPIFKTGMTLRHPNS